MYKVGAIRGQTWVLAALVSRLRSRNLVGRAYGDDVLGGFLLDSEGESVNAT